MVQPLLYALLVGVVVALIVYAYGYIVPPLLGRARYELPVVDVALMAVFSGLVIFILHLIGVWAKIATLV